MEIQKLRNKRKEKKCLERKDLIADSAWCKKTQTVTVSLEDKDLDERHSEFKVNTQFAEFIFERSSQTVLCVSVTVSKSTINSPALTSVVCLWRSSLKLFISCWRCKPAQTVHKYIVYLSFGNPHPNSRRLEFVGDYISGGLIHI